MTALSSFTLTLILLGCFFILGKAADVLVRALLSIGKTFKVQAFTLSFVLLGLTTSLPELLIGTYAVIDRVPTLALGNLLGGMVILLTLVVGLNGLIFGGIAIDGKFAKYSLCRLLPRVPFCHRLAIHDLAMIGGIFIAPALLILDGRLTRLDGALLVVLYVFYVWYYLKEPQSHTEADQDHPPMARSVGHFLLGALVLTVIARIVVAASEVLLVRLHVPPFLFGLLALGIGTNLPELMIMLKSRRDARDVSLGNALGSAAANVLIIGALALAAPLAQLNRPDIWLAVGMLALAVLLALGFLRTRSKLSRAESLGLVLLYVVFFAIQSFMGRL